MAAGDIRKTVVAGNGQYRPPAGRTELIVSALFSSNPSNYAIENGTDDFTLSGSGDDYLNVKIAIDNTNYLRSTQANARAYLTTVEV